MGRMRGIQNNEVVVLEHIEKIEEELAILRKQVSSKPLDYNAIDEIFQDIYATGWPSPKISEQGIKFVRAIEKAHGILENEQS